MIGRWLSFFVSPGLPSPREWPLVLAKVLSFGAAVGILLSLLLNVAVFTRLGWGDWPGFLLLSAGGGAVFSLCFYVTCGIPGMVLPRLLSDVRMPVRRWLLVTAGAVNACLGVTLGALILKVLFGARIRFVGQDHMGAMLVGEALLGAATSLTIMIVIESKRKKREAQAELVQARFAALQAQINPHFLFNTLNSISALIPRRPEDAQEMVARLAEMFRYALESQSEMVTLDQELAFVRNYVALEQIRFSDRLEADLPGGSYNGVRLPGLTLQPLVENAVKYGVAQRMEGGAVRLTVRRENGRCAIEVRNQFDSSAPPDLAPDRLFRKGHALSNIRERLRIHWQERSSVRVFEDAGWVSAVIEFPVEP